MVQEWDEEEVPKAVDAYFRMLELELRGERFHKSDFYWALSDDLGRSKGSVERQLMKTSAILVVSGGTYISGYKPNRYVHQLLLEAVEEKVAKANGLRERMVRVAVAPEVEFAGQLDREIPVPNDFAFPYPHGVIREGGGIDFSILEGANETRGRLGEKLVFNRERLKLAALGREDLAAQVRHVSVEDGDGLGYDVLSFTPDGEKRFLEVKTTVRSKYQPFHVSSKEVDFSTEEPERFSLVRVFSIHNKLGCYELHGSLQESAQLLPESYLGLPRASNH